MDKIKDIISPGHKKDDNVMYGNASPDDPVQMPNQGNPSGHASSSGDTRTPEQLEIGAKDPIHKDPASTTHSTGTTGHVSDRSHQNPSRMPGEFGDDAATSASIKSGIPGEPQSGNTLGSTPQGLGSNQAGTAPYSSGTTSGVVGSGIGTSSSQHPQDPRLSPRLNPKYETEDIKNPLSSGSATQSGLTGRPGDSHGSTNPLSSGRTSSPHGDESSGTSHIGGDAALGADDATGARGGASALHNGHHAGTDPSRSNPPIPNSSTTSPNHLSGQTGAYPAGGAALGSSAREPHSGSSTGTHAPSSGVAPGSDLGASGLTLDEEQRLWNHEHGGLSHEFVGDPCAAAGTQNPQTSGPHITETANRLDPRADGSSTNPATQAGALTGGSGVAPHSHSGDLGGSLGAQPSSGTHHGRDAHLVGGSGAGGLGGSEASREHPSYSSTSPAPGTAGPHKSDMLNKADPRVDSDLSKQGDATGAASQYPAAPDSSSSGVASSRHPTGREAGLTSATGVGSVGSVGAYEVGNDQDRHGPSLTSGSSQPQSDIGVASTTGGSGVSSAPSDYVTSSAPGSEFAPPSSNHGPSGGLGAGVGSTPSKYGTSSGRGSDKPLPPTSSNYGTDSGLDTEIPSHPTATTHKDHSARNATLGSGIGLGAGGLAAHELGKDHERREPRSTPTQQPYAAPGQSRDGGPTHTGTQRSYEPTSTSSHSGHTARDATLGGGALGAGADRLAAHGSGKEHKTTSSQPLAARDTTTHTETSGTHPTGTHPTRTSEKYADDQPRRVEDHTARNTALGAGAGAGAGALAAHEYDQNEAKKVEKEHEKEMKQAHKEHDKDVKHAQKEHDKDVKHAHKEHDKDVKHAEKKHDKDVKHAEKQHEKDVKKHEHDHEKEKKPGLVSRLLHRHDDDREAEKDAKRKDDEPLRDTDTSIPGHASNPRDRASDADTLSTSHTRDTVDHLRPGKTTHEAYDTTEGHNKLHKEPPAKLLQEQGVFKSG